MCLEACPTYQITRLETESPRGRIHLMINMLEGGPTSDTTRLHLDRCLACRACEVVCPSGVPYGHLIEAARTVIAEVDRPRRGWLSARLRRFALDNGPAYAHPRAVWFVDELPLAGTNKIDRKALVNRAAAAYSRENVRQV